MKIIKKILYWYRYKTYNAYKWAKCLGVNIGIDNQVTDKETFGTESYLITIGSHCQITKGVRIYTHGGGQALRNEIPDFDAFGKVYIGDYVYLGNNSMIMPGVTIGNNVIVGAGSIVTKSIPDSVVVAGSPARIICTLEEYKQRNIKFNVHSKGYSPTKKKEYLLSLDESKFIKKDFLSI